MRYHVILQEFVEQYALPAMQELGWSFKPAKSYGYAQAARGGAFHVDQPLRTHILNGLFGLTRIVERLVSTGYYRLSDTDFRKVLVLYMFHDAYKDVDLAPTQGDGSIFNVPLSALEDFFARTNLREFVDVSAAELRMASVSQLSPKVSDLLECPPGFSRLLTLVHLADSLASSQTARDFCTTSNRTQEISREDAVIALQQKRLGKRLSVEPPPVPPALKFYYHELDDYRGLSTLAIHQATEDTLAPYGFYPISYFANGILYLGPEELDIDLATLRTTIATTMFSNIQAQASQESYDATKEACQYGKNLKFRKDAYLFSSLEQLLQVVQDYPLARKSTGFLAKVVKKRVDKKKYVSVADFYDRYSIPFDADNSDLFTQNWNAAYFLFMGIESIAEALISADTLEWLFLTFHTPPHVAEAIRSNRSLLQTGGVSDHCLILSYHWLVNARFINSTRTAQQVAVIDVQQQLVQQAHRALRSHDTNERRLAFVNDELCLQADIKSYLQANLIFSFDPQRSIEDNRLSTYENSRARSHKRTCVICNRDIPVKMKSSMIITNIANQQAQVFSNKLQPSESVKAQMVWCPMCYLEFMLRKLGGQSFPAGSDYNASYRLYLYVLPDYSFTPELWKYTAERLFRNFQPKETVVSKLALRGTKDNPALPTLWLLERKVSPAWLEQVRSLFAFQAQHMKSPTRDGKPRSKQGDRITFSIKNPNYMLITYDNVVAERSEKNLAPTHVEVWTKALYTATLIHLLTGARVYITDRPYLSIQRPEQMKTIIEMEGIHPLLNGILPFTDREDVDLQSGNNSRRVPLSTLPVMLDLLSAAWEINAGLFQNTFGQRRNLDKQVANTLEELKTNYLAGATLFKMRERDKAAPYPAFTRACELLLPHQEVQSDPFRIAMNKDGYELMFDAKGGIFMSLSDRITNASLQLYSPKTGAKGRAHRFETLFRTGLDAIKNNASTSEDDEELISRVSGTVLKRLERIIESGGFSPTYGQQRLDVVNELATLLVRDLFKKICGASVSKLTHEENHFADAIYFLTFQKLNHYWDERRKQHPDEVETEDSDAILAISDL